jgi:predicted metal-dependent peptidase
MTTNVATKKQWADHKPEVTALALPQLKLDAAQEKAWTEARAKFLWDVPGFCAVLYSMMNPHAQQQKAIFTDQVPIAATDGLYMMLNPTTFLKLKLSERIFAMGHEVIHAICNHPTQMYNSRMRGKVSFTDGQSLPYNEDIWQRAADFVVNAILVSSKIGSAPEWVCLDPWYRQGNPTGQPIISHMDSIPDAYRKLWNDMPCNGGQGKLGVEGKLIDVLMEPGKAEGKPAEVAKQQRNEQEWKTAVAAAMESARVQGKLPGTMKDLFGEILEPRVSWQDYITGFFKRRLGGGAYNFRRADRRLTTRDPFIYAPARSGFGAETVVVAVDTSGSIGKAEVNLSQRRRQRTSATRRSTRSWSTSSMKENQETTPNGHSEYGPPNPPALTPRQEAQRKLRTALRQALVAQDRASEAKAVDDAARAILQGLRPDRPYAD